MIALPQRACTASSPSVSRREQPLCMPSKSGMTAQAQLKHRYSATEHVCSVLCDSE